MLWNVRCSHSFTGEKAVKPSRELSSLYLLALLFSYSFFPCHCFNKHVGEKSVYFGLLSLLSKYIFLAAFPREAQLNLTDDLHFLQFFTMLVLRIHILHPLVFVARGLYTLLSWVASKPFLKIAVRTRLTVNLVANLSVFPKSVFNLLRQSIQNNIKSSFKISRRLTRVQF